MTALYEDLVLRTAWLLSVTAVVLGVANRLHPGRFG
jgi:hypothetical protein